MDAPEQILRVAVPLVLGIGVSFLLDRRAPVRGFLPPGFRVPWRRRSLARRWRACWRSGCSRPWGASAWRWRRTSRRSATPQLFALHFLMLATLGAWFLLGYAGVVTRTDTDGARTGTDVARTDGADDFFEGVPEPPPPPPLSSAPSSRRSSASQAPNVRREIGLGVVLGHRGLDGGAAGLDGGRPG